MKFLLAFFKQKVPKSGTETPEYYHSALSTSEMLLAFYFLLSEILITLKTHHWQILPAVICAVMLGCAIYNKKMSMKLSIAVYTVCTILWTSWYVHTFGWGSGGQHLILPLLLLNFFNVFYPPWLKIMNWAGLIIYRMLLFAYAQSHVPVFTLDNTTGIMFQTLNSVILFLVLAIDYIIFSSSIQDTERQLRLNNQELLHEADTDPLTQLPNRRAMLDQIQLYCETYEDTTYSVAIGDIDFFKNINDTYGHICGDYTLQALAALFREKAGTEYSVCRWGGEEFCFFMPGKNIDDAWILMFDVCDSVRKLDLEFGGKHFSVTITIGIEENDFRSSINDILEKADKKLYMGKVEGRNRVVM